MARVSSTSRPSGQQDKLGRFGQASSFARSRERRPSLGSSNAEDDADREYEEDDEEDIDEDEDEGEMDDDDSTTRGDKTGLLESHHVDVGMQDIQEESEASHSADRRHFHPSEPMAEQAMSTQH